MRDYIYKVIIFSIAIIIIFQFTIGEQISRVTDRIEIFTSADGRKQVVESLKKKLEKLMRERIILMMMRENY